MNEEQQKQYIRDNYLEIPSKRIAKQIGRSDCFVRGFMKREGLVVPHEIVEKRKRQSRFQKGATPVNKGKKQEEFMSQEAIERTKKTRFKKGRKPHNTNYDGHISIRNSKGRPYKWIRVAEGEYVLLHRKIWEEAKGLIPDSCNIQFKDGNTLNCELSNLYLIEKKYQASINHSGLSKMPPELIESTILLTKLKHKTNEKQNDRPQ